ncbi:hypothetical protein [Kordia jejudonensis]|uniref:hypothetical protein n=1 Tax=Kordia jejudonensis TaxID=1348245 RepID=UPI0006298064|nr:hypothetical protein [Kordia jejudonensis]
MKNHFLILFLFTCSISFACSCSPPKSILEFYNATYVFEGEIVSKVYAEDAQTYTVRFAITEHYKNGEQPKELSFVLKSEEFYTNESTSCDWSANKGEKWLVYAHLNDIDLLSFDGMCSNSKRIDYHGISDDEQKVLDNGNSFVIGNYAYQNESGFNYTTPVTNIDSILKGAKKGNYKHTFTSIKIHIDKKGNLQNVASENHYPIEYDSNFGLAKGFINTVHEPSSDFEKEAIRIAKNIKKWEIKYHKKTKIPVSQIYNIIFTYDKKTNTWSYEL